MKKVKQIGPEGRVLSAIMLPFIHVVKKNNTCFEGKQCQVELWPEVRPKHSLYVCTFMMGESVKKSPLLNLYQSNSNGNNRSGYVVITGSCYSLLTCSCYHL